jgi:hypothetical protein
MTGICPTFRSQEDRRIRPAPSPFAIGRINRSRAAVGTARVGGWNGARWNGANWNHGAFRHGRFVHRHGRVFFVGGGPWWVGGYDSCWQWVATPWGLRQAWVCGDYGYY